ncbi:MAG: HEAT repeat domain-containing protein [Planctomycetaceae bacterium]
MRHRLYIFATLLAIGEIVCGGGSACGDVIRFKQGGEVRGKLTKRTAGTDELVLETMTGATLVVHRNDIEFFTIRPIEVEEYESRVRNMPPSVEAHLELAEWCQQHRLHRQREEQLEAILQIEPHHADAHRALGHVEENGEWMTKEEQMALRGYVKHKGRYVTQQQLDLIEKSAEQREAEKAWFTKIRGWQAGLEVSDTRKVNETLDLFRSLTDADAVPALQQYLANHSDRRFRLLLVNVLQQISGPKVINSLVERSIMDSDAEIRKTAIAAISPEQTELAAPQFVRALVSNDIAVVNRAAFALGQLGDDRVVPALIDALVTSHRVTYYVPDSNPVTFSNGPNGPTPGTSSSNLQGQIPPGAIVNPPIGMYQKTRKVQARIEVANEEVLAALRKLTTEDFGYNERTWKLWWSARQNMASAPALQAG